ncbi:MAG: HD domain-containing protein [Acidobacteriota bacterium]|nr:HD domain-containing protein [Acidobacteriota bacterium]
MDLSNLQAAYPWFNPLLARFRAHLDAEEFSRDPAHELSHSLRVARLAHRICEAEKADGDVAVAAALLHDLVWLPKNHENSKGTAEMSAELAPSLCSGLPVISEKSGHIAECILTHSFSGGGVAASLEARIVQDADRLEAIGAIGLARVFATGASFGAALWDSADPWARRRHLDDKAYSLDHFEKKLLKLAEGMNTQASIALAASRQQVLLGYLDALREELG